MPPVLNAEACIQCQTCVEICPVDVLRPAKDGGAPDIRYPDECWHCNSCVLDCPAGALSLRVPLPASLLYVDARR